MKGYRMLVGAVKATGSFVKRHAKKALGIAGVSTVALAGNVSAAAQDWTAISTAVTAEIGAVMPIAMTTAI